MINYRHDTPLDWPAIVEYLGGVDEFAPVDPTTLGGHWIVAVDDAGKLYGTVWCFTEPPHVYVGYWAADGAVVGSKLLICFHQFCYKNKIKYLHSMIAEDNLPALRMAVMGMGGTASPAHCRIYKELEYVGTRADDPNNDDTGSGRAGDGPAGVTRKTRPKRSGSAR